MQARYQSIDRPGSGRKSRARSFYMDVDLISDLEAQSKRTGMSINALVNKTLKESTLHAYSTKEYSSIIVPGALLRGVLNPANEEVFTDFGRKNGGGVLKDAVMTGGRPKNLETFRYYLRDGYCGHSNWAEYFERIFEDKIIIKLNHSLGLVWSKFMKEYFYAGMCEVLGKKNIPEEAFSVTDAGLVIVLPISHGTVK
jgi:hypothetical protein